MGYRAGKQAWLAEDMGQSDSFKKGKGNGTTVLDGIERIGSAADFGGEQDNSVKSKGLKIQEGFESPSFLYLFLYFCL